MSDKYPFIPEYLEKSLEDISIPLIDLMHDYFKVQMLECQEEMENTSELQDSKKYHYLNGFMAALTKAYVLTYNLSIDRKNIEEKYNA
jgi:flagellar biosynthesis regulator FlbT